MRFGSFPQWIWGAAAAAVVIAPAFAVGSASTLRIASLFFVSLVILLGLHVTTSLAGVVSLCHAALVGVGAYVGGIVARSTGGEVVASLACGALAAAVVATSLSALTQRLEDHYLALATLAASEVLCNVFRSATGVTGGANGLAGIPPLAVAGHALARPASYYPLAAMLGCGALATVAWLHRCSFGHALRALGDEGPLVASVGLSPGALRTAGFAVGAAMAGLAGVVLAQIDGFVGPESFGAEYSIAFLCFLMIGRVRSLDGVVLGAFMASVGAEILRDLQRWQTVVLAAACLAMLCSRRPARTRVAP